jgi:hypothetical protein
MRRLWRPLRPNAGRGCGQARNRFAGFTPLPIMPRRTARRAERPHPRFTAQRRLAVRTADHSRSTRLEPAPLLGSLLQLFAPHPPSVQAEPRPSGLLSLLPRRAQRPVKAGLWRCLPDESEISPSPNAPALKRFPSPGATEEGNVTERGSLTPFASRRSGGNLGGELSLGDRQALVRDLNHTVDLCLAHNQWGREVHHVPDPGNQAALQG